MTKFTSKFLKKIIVISLIASFLAVPGTASADWADIFGGIFNGGILGGNSSSQSYDPTAQQNYGDLELSKRVRRVDQDQNYHEDTSIAGETLVEIWIEVKNKSSRSTNVVVTDELGSNAVYKTGSFNVNSQSTGSLTGGGMTIALSANSRVVITYQMYVCSGSSYPIRASAYASGVGSANDAIVIYNDYEDYGYSYYSQYNSCGSQYSATTYNSPVEYYGPPITYQSGNPFGDWTGVNNSNNTYNTNTNPFGGWTGVNNSNNTYNTNTNPFGSWIGVNNSNNTYNTNTNPFGGWTGVNNSNAAYNTNTNPFGGWTGVDNSNATYNTNTNPFGGWTGVNNSNNTYNTNTNPFGEWSGTNNSGATYNTNTNPFGEWTGVNNSNATHNTNTNPFGTWSGVNNSDQVTMNASNNSASNVFGEWTGVNNSQTMTSVTSSNPFSDWTGVNNNLEYNSQGYSNARVASANTDIAATSRTATTQSTYFVAPLTGTNKTTPLWITGFIVIGFILYRKRKLIFN